MVVMVGTALAFDAPDTPPKSPAAIAAIHKADVAQKAAQENYDTTVFKLKKTEDDELKTALKIATQKGDLDEANAINAVVKNIESEYGKTYKPASTVINMNGKWDTWEGHETDKISIASTTCTYNNDFSGTATISGNVMIIKWQNGYTYRSTFVGDRFFFESWKPQHAMTEPAFVIGVGTRAADQ
jgi:hypothetical protein